MGPADVIAKLIDATMDFNNDACLSPQFDDQGFIHTDRMTLNTKLPMPNCWFDSVLLKRPLRALDKPERKLMKVESECRMFAHFITGRRTSGAQTAAGSTCEHCLAGSRSSRMCAYDEVSRLIAGRHPSCQVFL
jgi:hypothetical protein